jgi:AraC-like DNA-binding protein
VRSGTGGSRFVNQTPTSPIQYFPPDDDLTELISTFYIAHFPVASFDEYERADRPQFRLRLNDTPGEYHLPSGEIVPAYGATIIGPTSRPVRAISHGPVHLIGMGLMPGGWATLMGPDAAKYGDRALHAHELFGDWIYEVGATIAAARDDQERIAMMQQLAREIMQRGEPAPLWFTRTVDNWLVSSLSPNVDDLVSASGMSARSVERLTKRFYGVSPKLLARKYRALRAAAALARGEKLDEASLADAFYDQSHLIREVKQFSGMTPSKLVHASDYFRATTEGRRNLRGRVSPLITDT